MQASDQGSDRDSDRGSDRDSDRGSDRDNIMSKTAGQKAKKGRTPLKQSVTSRAVATPLSTPLPKRRNRLPGKRKVKSCTACRASHCSLMQGQHAPTPSQRASASSPDVIDPKSPQAEALQRIASASLALMAEKPQDVSSPESDVYMDDLIVESPVRES
ncbi:hypothetical protein SAMD00023353_3200880 [Rosellinia necatrix]|uniref:Uncharacterized protein n=1 Tax=Rosellinia necatrix TaxID=77044 RepID=A0A1S8A8S1_ROSNE|nr:hypothetical protein SAMD00023353_3200880 [Rosellinia necatrix]